MVSPILGSGEQTRNYRVPYGVPSDDEVLVRVRAASVHTDVWHVVTGGPYVLRLMGSGLRQPKNPVPGTDTAGIVELVGKNVTLFKAGDAVFGECIDKTSPLHPAAEAIHYRQSDEACGRIILTA